MLINVHIGDVQVSPEPWRVTLRVSYRLKKSVAVDSREKYAMAVNPNQTVLAVALWCANCIALYSLPEGTARGMLTATAGSSFQFKNPISLLFTSVDALLVADRGLNMVLWLTLDGRLLRQFKVASPWSLAAHGDMLAVGKLVSKSGFGVEMFSLATGAQLAQFGERGASPGCVGYCAEACKFTDNGTRLLVLETTHNRLSLFSVTGEFIDVVGHVGLGLIAGSLRSVCWDNSGRLLVADSQNHRMCTFASTGLSLQCSWGECGDGDGQFRLPSCVVVAGQSRQSVYVLDRDAPRVNIYDCIAPPDDDHLT